MACCSPSRLISIIVTIIAIIGGVFVAYRLKGEAIVFLLLGVRGLIIFVLIVLLEGQIEHKEYEDNIEQAKWEKENRRAREIRDLENQLASEIDLLGDQITEIETFLRKAGNGEEMLAWRLTTLGSLQWRFDDAEEDLELKEASAKDGDQ
ncbi:hypothetical protein RIF29_13867 [Crotalaria pallida]|uniref:Uncharacterized protein n=1 Tax=Crotalaria pallida TaxID=3830 RepID=A0AAN9IB22_CROPI